MGVRMAKRNGLYWRRACNNWNKKTELPWPLVPWHVLEECHHGPPVLSLLPRLQRLAAVVGEDGVGAILVPVLLLLPNHVGLLVNRGREGSGERAGFPAEGGDRGGEDRLSLNWLNNNEERRKFGKSFLSSSASFQNVSDA